MYIEISIFLSLWCGGCGNRKMYLDTANSCIQGLMVIDELRRNYSQSRLHANLQVVTAGKLELTRAVALRIYGMMIQTKFIQTHDNL